MHMADALLSPAVGGVMCAVSAGAVVYAAQKLKKDGLEEQKVPLMGIAGAFVFAAQMVNFTIPVTGSSGHIGGGILLAALLGEFPAFLTITAVLLIQALFFADGGLLALGCNVFNMGVLPCFFAYPLLFRPIVNGGWSRKRITAASVLAVVLGLQAGAFSVVLETLASGITELPFGAFVLLMQPIHLAIGLVEGVITAAVLLSVYQMRPELLEKAKTGAVRSVISAKRVIAVFAVLAVLTGCGLSLLASSQPDGLEWAVGAVAGTAELEPDTVIHAAAAALQNRTAILPDYGFADGEAAIYRAGTSVSGLVGGALTFLFAGAAGLAITAAKKRKKAEELKI